MADEFDDDGVDRDWFLEDDPFVDHHASSPFVGSDEPAGVGGGMSGGYSALNVPVDDALSSHQSGPSTSAPQQQVRFVAPEQGQQVVYDHGYSVKPVTETSEPQQILVQQPVSQTVQQQYEVGGVHYIQQPVHIQQPPQTIQISAQQVEHGQTTFVYQPSGVQHGQQQFVAVQSSQWDDQNGASVEQPQTMYQVQYFDEDGSQSSQPAAPQNLQQQVDGAQVQYATMQNVQHQQEVQQSVAYVTADGRVIGVSQSEGQQFVQAGQQQFINLPPGAQMVTTTQGYMVVQNTASTVQRVMQPPVEQHDLKTADVGMSGKKVAKPRSKKLTKVQLQQMQLQQQHVVPKAAPQHVQLQQIAPQMVVLGQPISMPQPQPAQPVKNMKKRPQMQAVQPVVQQHVPSIEDLLGRIQGAMSVRFSTTEASAEFGNCMAAIVSMTATGETNPAQLLEIQAKLDSLLAMAETESAAPAPVVLVQKSEAEKKPPRPRKRPPKKPEVLNPVPVTVQPAQAQPIVYGVPSTSSTGAIMVDSQLGAQQNPQFHQNVEPVLNLPPKKPPRKRPTKKQQLEQQMQQQQVQGMYVVNAQGQQPSQIAVRLASGGTPQAYTGPDGNYVVHVVPPGRQPVPPKRQPSPVKLPDPKDLCAEIQKKDAQRKNKIECFFNTVRDRLDKTDYVSAFKDIGDVCDRLLPFALLSEPDFSDKHLHAVDDEFIRHHAYMTTRIKKIENHMQRIYFSELADGKEHDHEKNMLLYLDAEYERKRLASDKIEAEKDLESFLRESEIIRAGVGADEIEERRQLLPPKPKNLVQQTQFEYHPFDESVYLNREIPRTPSPQERGTGVGKKRRKKDRHRYTYNIYDSDEDEEDDDDEDDDDDDSEEEEESQQRIPMPTREVSSSESEDGYTAYDELGDTEVMGPRAPIHVQTVEDDDKEEEISSVQVVREMQPPLSSEPKFQGQNHSPDVSVQHPLSSPVTQGSLNPLSSLPQPHPASHPTSTVLTPPSQSNLPATTPASHPQVDVTSPPSRPPIHVQTPPAARHPLIQHSNRQSSSLPVQVQSGLIPDDLMNVEPFFATNGPIISQQRHHQRSEPSFNVMPSDVQPMITQKFQADTQLKRYLAEQILKDEAEKRKRVEEEQARKRKEEEEEKVKAELLEMEQRRKREEMERQLAAEDMMRASRMREEKLMQQKEFLLRKEEEEQRRKLLLQQQQRQQQLEAEKRRRLHEQQQEALRNLQVQQVAQVRQQMALHFPGASNLSQSGFPFNLGGLGNQPQGVQQMQNLLLHPQRAQFEQSVINSLRGLPTTSPTAPKERPTTSERPPAKNDKSMPSIPTHNVDGLLRNHAEANRRVEEVTVRPTETTQEKPAVNERPLPKPNTFGLVLKPVNDADKSKFLGDLGAARPLTLKAMAEHFNKPIEPAVSVNLHSSLPLPRRPLPPDMFKKTKHSGLEESDDEEQKASTSNLSMNVPSTSSSQQSSMPLKWRMKKGFNPQPQQAVPEAVHPVVSETPRLPPIKLSLNMKKLEAAESEAKKERKRQKKEEKRKQKEEKKAMKRAREAEVEKSVALPPPVLAPTPNVVSNGGLKIKIKMEKEPTLRNVVPPLKIQTIPTQAPLVNAERADPLPAEICAVRPAEGALKVTIKVPKPPELAPPPPPPLPKLKLKLGGLRFPAPTDVGNGDNDGVQPGEELEERRHHKKHKHKKHHKRHRSRTPLGDMDNEKSKEMIPKLKIKRLEPPAVSTADSASKPGPSSSNPVFPVADGPEFSDVEDDPDDERLRNNVGRLLAKFK